MLLLLAIALGASVLYNLYQLALRVALGRDHAWGIRSQGDWHGRLPLARLRALVQPVAIIHLDIDHLKQLNAVLGEARVNTLLRSALRRSELYRTQHGDECTALLWGRQAAQPERVARAMLARLAAAPLTPDERARLGGPLSATVVYSPPTRHLRATLPRLVAQREAMKAQGQRGTIARLNEGEPSNARVVPGRP